MLSVADNTVYAAPYLSVQLLLAVVPAVLAAVACIFQTRYVLQTVPATYSSGTMGTMFSMAWFVPVESLAKYCNLARVSAQACSLLGSWKLPERPWAATSSLIPSAFPRVAFAALSIRITSTIPTLTNLKANPQTPPQQPPKPQQQTQRVVAEVALPRCPSSLCAHALSSFDEESDVEADEVFETPGEAPALVDACESPLASSSGTGELSTGPWELSAVDACGSSVQCPAVVAEILPERFLLQFGALIGEQASMQALVDQQLPWAWGSDSEVSLFGLMEGPKGPSGPPSWELCVQNEAEGISYQTWRMPLRKGYNLWLSRTALQDATVAEVTRFNTHTRTRFLWDETAMVHEDLDCGEDRDPEGLNCVQQYRCRYPAPMAAREYVYARRAWRRPDGAVYIVSRACDVPQSGLAVQNGRVCGVKDYISCMLVQPVAVAEGAPPVTEVITVYYEDPSSPPSVTNIAIRKGLWTFTLKHAAALREFSVQSRAVANAPEATDADTTAEGSRRARIVSADAASGHGLGRDDALLSSVMARIRARSGARPRGPLRKLVRSSSRVFAQGPARALKPLAVLSAHPLLRQKVVVLLAFRLLHGVVAAREQ